MHKLSLAVTPAFMLALAMSAVAQEKPLTTKKDMVDTVKVNVSGRLVLDYVWRSSELEAAVVTGGTLGTGESENTFEGYAAVRFEVELTDKVSAVVEVGTERVDAGAINAWGQASASAGLDVVLREANVVLGDFLTSGLWLQIGIETWAFDVRGKGSAFAFDPRHSQSFGRNLGGPALTNAPEELQPVGGVFTYKREQLSLDFVLLPAAIEAGPASADEALYAVDMFYTFDNQGSRFAAILALVDLGGDGVNSGGISGRNGAVFTLGVGAVLKGLTKGLDLYGEIYFQFGSAGVNETAADQELDAGGIAFQLGADFTLDTGVFFGVNLTFISGDDDLTDGDVDSFLSYENVNDLMILEDMYFGIDWDTNYFAVKLSGGIPLQIKTKDDLVISAILGITKTNEDIAFGPNNEDALGTEFDVRARWAVTKQASLQAGVGFLFGSDILEQSLGGSANDNADDSAIIYTVGADLRF